VLTSGHNLCEELNKKIEQMQSGLQTVMMSLNHRIWGTQIEVQTKKVLMEKTHYGLEAKIAEVMDDFSMECDLA
jgi:hypothetical protein